MGWYNKKLTFQQNYGLNHVKGLKLWHDDVRPPPDESWDIWARNNNAAQVILATDIVTECSLDHDLGAVQVGIDPSDVMYLAGDSRDGSGLDLVKWMVRTKHLPKKITIHSWNPPGASAMADVFKKFLDENRHISCHVLVQPFVLN